QSSSSSSFVLENSKRSRTTTRTSRCRQVHGPNARWKNIEALHESPCVRPPLLQRRRRNPTLRLRAVEIVSAKSVKHLPSLHPFQSTKWRDAFSVAQTFSLLYRRLSSLLRLHFRWSLEAFKDCRQECPRYGRLESLRYEIHEGLRRN